MKNDYLKRKKYPTDLSGKQWVVERIFAWLGNSRRLAKDFEKTIMSAEAMIKIPHCHTLLKLL